MALCALFLLSGGVAATRLFSLLHTCRTLRGLDLLEEVIAFVIHQDKRREIFHFNFPDRFHTQFRVFHALQALDAALRQYGRRTTDTAQVEPAVLVARIRHLLAAVAFRQHDHAAAVGLELVYIGVHAACGGWA